MHVDLEITPGVDLSAQRQPVLGTFLGHGRRRVLEFDARHRARQSEVVFEDRDNPLLDPRVAVHVEDGRYFLQSTEKRFDLVTAEPPPPNLGHVTYLYTQEYFQLAHDRLREGGMISYWLPVESLEAREAGSIVNAFCTVFADCSLWRGASLNWILLGSRGGIAPVTAESFVRQWQDPNVAKSTRAVASTFP